MSYIMAFDTLKFSQSLQNAGLSKTLADAHAKLQADIWQENVKKNLATKADVYDLKVELQQEIRTEVTQLEVRMDKRFEQVDKRFEQVDQRFEQVDKRFEQVDKRFEQVDRRFEQVDKQFEQMGKRFEQVDKRLHKLDTGMENLNEKANMLAVTIERMANGLSNKMMTMMGVSVAFISVLMAVFHFIH